MNTRARMCMHKHRHVYGHTHTDMHTATGGCRPARCATLTPRRDHVGYREQRPEWEVGKHDTAATRVSHCPQMLRLPFCLSEWGLTVWPRLASNSRAQGDLLPQSPRTGTKGADQRTQPVFFSL